MGQILKVGVGELAQSLRGWKVLEDVGSGVLFW